MLTLPVRFTPDKAKTIASRYEVTLLNKKRILTNTAVHAEWRLFDKTSKTDYSLFKTGSDYQITCLGANWKCLFSLDGVNICIESAIRNNRRIKSDTQLMPFEPIITDISAIKQVSLID